MSLSKNVSLSDLNEIKWLLCFSAGVGRTGTMIAIDISLDHMVQFGTVDVLGCVTKLRSQRNYMVQSDDQYQFIYEAILEAASTPGDTEVPADQLSAYIQDLKAVDGKSGISKLSFEYQVICSLDIYLNFWSEFHLHLTF